MPPVTKSIIEMEATGGDAAASQLGKAATALGNVGKAGEQAAAKGRGSAGSFRDFRQALDLVLPGANQFLDALKDIQEGSQFATASASKYSSTLAALAPAVLAAGAALTAVVAVWWANKRAADEVAKATEANLKAHNDLIRTWEDAVAKGVRLTAMQRDYVEQLKKTRDAELQNRIAQLSSKTAVAENEAVYGSFTDSLIDFGAILFGLDGLHAKISSKQTKAALDAKLWKAEIESLAKTGKTLEQNMSDQTAALDKLTAATAAAAAAQDELEKARSPKRSFSIEISAIERDRAARIDAARQQVKDQAVLAQTVQEINEEAAARSSLAWIKAADEIGAQSKKAADDTKAEWEQATAGLRSAAEGFGFALIDNTRKGTLSATQLFADFAEGVVQEIERMVAKAAAAKLFQFLMPAGGIGGGLLGGLLGFQFGGVVPGPEGQPRPAMVHGGDQITGPTGRGGRGPDAVGGGNTSITYNMGGVFTSVRALQRTQRRDIRSAGQAGLA